MASIVMVHGAFCGGWTFERFRGPFEAAGFDVIAPDLRGHAAGRASEVTGVSMSDYAADIAEICAALRECVVTSSFSGAFFSAGAATVGVRAAMAMANAPRPVRAVAVFVGKESPRVSTAARTASVACQCQERRTSEPWHERTRFGQPWQTDPAPKIGIRPA